MARPKTGPKPISYYLDKCERVGECLLWHGAMSGFGYPVANINGRGTFTYLHVYVCEQTLGEKLPKGYDVDHICNTPNCLEPKHLRFLTHEENIARNPNCGWKGYHKRRKSNG